MITEIEKIMKTDIEAIQASYLLLDIAVNVVASFFTEQGVQMDPDKGIFFIDIDKNHKCAMMVGEHKRSVNITITEDADYVAELLLLVNGEYEERFKKFKAGVELKNQISTVFDMIETAVDHVKNGGFSNDVADTQEDESTTETIDSEENMTDTEVIYPLGEDDITDDTVVTIEE